MQKYEKILSIIQVNLAISLLIFCLTLEKPVSQKQAAEIKAELQEIKGMLKEGILLPSSENVESATDNPFFIEWDNGGATPQ